MNPQLELIDVSVAYGDNTVVNEVSLQLEQGEIGCLLGPSGCGKTSLLRAIAGFEVLSTGEIRLHGQSVSRPGTTLSPERREVGMVFQDFALYPHLSVSDNIGFGLRKLSRKKRRQRVDELLQLTGMESENKKFPHQLSGGQQQRVALARAMAPRPRILLLDEPFSGLDIELREQLAHEVRQLLREDGVTAILVTHDQLEAFAMADRIGVLGNGRLHQWASAYELYHRPATHFVANFIGQGTMLEGLRVGKRRVRTVLGELSENTVMDSPEGEAVWVLLRPDDLIHDDSSPLKLRVLERVFRGASFLYTLELPDGNTVYSLVPSHHKHAIGEHIGIFLNADHVVAFPMRSQGQTV